MSRRTAAAVSRILPDVIERGRGAAHTKYALERYAAIRVAPLVTSFRLRRVLLGDERAYLELSERAARWPGVLGERMRMALHRALGTPIGDATILKFGCIFERPPLSVGRMTVISHYAKIQHARIGDDCLIGDHVLVFDGRGQHSFERLDVPINAQGGTVKQVRVGDDCFIGGRAVILADVGDHSVVAAGSIVTHPVGAYEIVAGNPARVIGDRRERSWRPGNGDSRVVDA
jgi:virginiamycin A acetyltransferase